MSEIRFPGQYPDEKVILLIRRSPFVLTFYAIVFGLMAVLPILIFLIGPVLLPTIFNSPLMTLFAFLAIIYYLFLWTLSFIVIVCYYFDIWIITNERILDIEQKGLFSRTVSELRLVKIQDITSEVPGFIPTLIGFGNIYIQTAGEIERFDLKEIPHPVETRKIIDDLYNQALEREGFKEKRTTDVSGL